VDGTDPGSGPPRAEDGPPLVGAPGGDSRARPRWPLRFVVLLSVASLLAAFAVGVILLIGLGVARGPALSRGPDEIFLLTIASDGALLAVLFLIARRAGIGAADLGFRRPSRGAIGDAAAAAVGLWLLSIAVNLVSARIFGPHPQSLVETFAAHHGALAFGFDFAASALVAPFAEETLFRGVIFGGLAQRLPLWSAAALSALLFALFHGLGVVPPIFVLGVGLAYVYARTGTIWASMTTHALVNAVSVTLLFTQQGF
jgi:membrane protease YdiL (CAAX protease family)